MVEDHAGENEAVSNDKESEGEANLPPKPCDRKRKGAGYQGAKKNGGRRYARQRKSAHRRGG